jgi:ABC-type multidrug transport system fused ATPase/permease subunit
VTQQKLNQVCRTVVIYGKICSLASGYDTVLGEGVGTFSAGEKQRLEIARALWKDHHILLLDEHISALDPKTERHIRKSIERLRGRTIIIVAHRLSTVVNAHKIVVLDQGQVAEEGTHDDLLAAKGIYLELWDAEHYA